MGEPHEMDRRFVDQQFKLKITSQIAEIQTELKHNTNETKEIKDSLKEFQRNMDITINGAGPLNLGLAGQSLENKIAIGQLRDFMKRWLPIIGLVTVLFADQLSPLIRDWLYEKTHLKVFYSVAQEFKEEKSKPKVTHYKIIYRDRNTDEAIP